MIVDATTKRICWHAGLELEGPEDIPSVSSSTWPRGRATGELRNAVDDCLKILAGLNRELNGEVPSHTVSHALDIPRRLVYAVAEVVRMIRMSQEQAQTEDNERELALAAWRIETAWLAVLAGDIDDVLKHVEQEEAMKKELK